MKIIVVGSGPAGSSASYHLVKDGHEVVILDPLGAHEKTCGGGVPQKTFTQFPYLYDDYPAAKNLLNDFQISFNEQEWCRFDMFGGLGIFSRAEHDGHLLEKAKSAGAIHLKERFSSCTYADGKWSIKTDKAMHEADYLVGADGAVSRVRNQVAKKLPKDAYFKTCDYLLPKMENVPLHVGFHKEIDGYLWFFPRENSCSVGIGDFSNDHKRRHRLLDRYLAQLGVSQDKIIEKRSALIPSLRESDIAEHEVAGEGWSLVGDAAGLAEPITGEGIYFAVYTGEFMARCLRENRSYQDEFKTEFASLLRECKHSRLAYKIVNSAMARFIIKRSPEMRKMIGLCMAAVESPHVYRRQLMWKMPKILGQAFFRPQLN